MLEGDVGERMGPVLLRVEAECVMYPLQVGDEIDSIAGHTRCVECILHIETTTHRLLLE